MVSTSLENKLVQANPYFIRYLKLELLYSDPSIDNQIIAVNVILTLMYLLGCNRSTVRDFCRLSCSA